MNKNDNRQTITLCRELEKRMEEQALSMKRLSVDAGLNETAVRDILKGRVKSPSYSTLTKLAAQLGCSVAELYGKMPERASASAGAGGNILKPQEELTGWGVPVVGYIGAGAEIFPVDDYPLGQGMYEADTPPGLDAKALVAVEVRGESMLPVMKNGWLVYYRREHDGVEMNAYGQLCVVKVADDGPMLIKELRRGYSMGLYNLFSYNAELIEDVKLDWAARVLFIKPR